jgi:hypothetical protein
MDILYNSKISCEMNGHCTIDDKVLAKNRNVKVRIQILKSPQVSGEKKSGHNDYRGTGGWFS